MHRALVGAAFARHEASDAHMPSHPTPTHARFYSGCNAGKDRDHRGPGKVNPQTGKSRPVVSLLHRCDSCGRVVCCASVGIDQERQHDRQGGIQLAARSIGCLDRASAHYRTILARYREGGAKTIAHRRDVALDR